MSAVNLRISAIDGDHNRLASMLMEIANTCSADEFDLTPLMYAVWGGHIECVKYLVANDFGVSKIGVKRSSLDMVSTKGYSALHLAAIDCPKSKCQQIVFVLLAMNVNTSLQCKEGKTAHDLALENNNTEFLATYSRFENSSDLDNEDSKLRRDVQSLREALSTKYAFAKQCTLYVKPFRTNFPMPKFIFSNELRNGSIPLECKLHEGQLKPLIETSFSNIRSTSNSIRALQFAIEEADTHAVRRMKLVNAQDPTFDPSDTANTGGHITQSRTYRKIKPK